MKIVLREGCTLNAYRVDGDNLEFMKRDIRDGVLPKNTYWKINYSHGSFNPVNMQPEVRSVEVISDMETKERMTVPHGQWVIFTPVGDAFRLTNDAFCSVFVKEGTYRVESA